MQGQPRPHPSQHTQTSQGQCVDLGIIQPPNKCHKLLPGWSKTATSTKYSEGKYSEGTKEPHPVGCVDSRASAQPQRAKKRASPVSPSSARPRGTDTQKHASWELQLIDHASLQVNPCTCICWCSATRRNKRPALLPPARGTLDTSRAGSNSTCGYTCRFLKTAAWLDAALSARQASQPAEATQGPQANDPEGSQVALLTPRQRVDTACWPCASLHAYAPRVASTCPATVRLTAAGYSLTTIRPDEMYPSWVRLRGGNPAGPLVHLPTASPQAAPS